MSIAFQFIINVKDNKLSFIKDIRKLMSKLIKDLY